MRLFWWLLSWICPPHCPECGTYSTPQWVGRLTWTEYWRCVECDHEWQKDMQSEDMP